MCTVSWLSRPDGYEVFFNRDEQPSRPAGGPRRAVAGEVAYLAPVDLEAGGTWIAVNQFGVTVCLTNQYPDRAPPPADRISRGLLLAALVDAESLDRVAGRVRDLALERYRPFAVAAFEPDADPMVLRWDGRRLATDRPHSAGMVLTSSGATPPDLESTRAGIFAAALEAGVTAAALAAVHRSHLPARGALSVCMHRPEASTVSHSHIVVAHGSRGISFSHAPGAPCETALGDPLTMPRVERTASSQ